MSDYRVSGGRAATFTEPATPRVLIADDVPGTRDLIEQMLISEGLEVVGQAGDGLEAIRLAADLEADVVLMDLRMPRKDGLDATRVLRSLRPDIEVVILTMFQTEGVSDAAHLAGAFACYEKGTAFSELARTIRAATARARSVRGGGPAPAADSA